MPSHIARRNVVEIQIGDAPLGWKLAAIGAALAAVRDAHRDTMPVACWAEINRAHEALARAILASATAAKRPAICRIER